MISQACTPFVNAIRQARLLSDAQLAEITRSHDAAYHEPRDLAKELVRRDWLTPFQVERLAHGKGSELVLGKYVLLERLGEGGMGQVFKARHRVMDRLVALKIIRPDLLHHPSAVRRFHQEIRAVSQLSHPNIVTAHDADQEGDTHFLVMEYVQGIDLKQLVQTNGRLGIGQACDYTRQAALGLQHAHERGLVHRDLKPGNLLLTLPRREPQGTLAMPSDSAAPGAVVKILDLGLALLRSSDPGRSASSVSTQKGSLIGTPDYMAPEQAIDPRHVDIRADLYSLGCTLFYLLTARPPFNDGSLLEKLYKHKFEPPPALASLRPDVPADVAAIVHKLIAKEPEDRFQTPAEAIKALTPFCHAAEAVAMPSKTWPEPSSPRRAASTFGVTDGPPDTMSMPDVSAVDDEGEPTSGAWVSLERALDALDSAKPGVADTKKLPGISSVSEFKAWDSKLDQPPIPAQPPVKKRGRLVAALLLGAVAVGALGFAVARFGWGSGEKTEQQPPLFVQGGPSPAPKGAPADDDPKQKKAVEPAPIKETTTTKLNEHGEAKPLFAALRADLASSKLDSERTDENARATDKRSTLGECIISSVSGKHPLDSAAFTSDGKRAVLLSEDTVSLVDLETFLAGRKPVVRFEYPFQTLQAKQAPMRVGLAQRDCILLATFDRILAPGQIRQPAPLLGSYELDNPHPLRMFETGGATITCVAGCPADARLAVTGDQAGTVGVWQLSDGLRPRYSWSRHQSLVEALTVAAEGSRALSGDRRGKLWVWDLKKGEPLHELVGHRAPINAVAMSADGSLAASADDDTVRLWDVTNAKELRQLPRTGLVQCLALSQDGKRLVTGGKDSVVRLWNAETGTLLREWSGHTAAILAVVMTPERDAVFSVAKDNTIRRWGFYPAAGTPRP